jgi:hypothetical protein
MMDSQSINKDNQLKQTLNLLLKKYDDKILIKDYWDADLCAIGLCDISENYLIYISTYSLLPGKHNIILEDITDREKPLPIREYNDITFENLEEILKDFFKIK